LPLVFVVVVVVLSLARHLEHRARRRSFRSPH
jgi:hypothetical protein